MSSVFGLNECSELVHVSEVTRGLACHCRCVACGEPLLARQGEVRGHHFAHASNLEACESSFESLLHRYAKQLVVQARGMMVPTTTAVNSLLGWEAGHPARLLHAPGDVHEEVHLGSIRPDLLMVTDDGVLVAIEIAHSSFCDGGKVREFEQMRLPALEVDLSSFTPEGFDPTAVRHAVIDALQHKRWVWPEEHATAAETADPAVPSPKPPEAMATEARPVRLPEEIINFDGRWVSIKQFPSGDIAVKVVSWDPDLVSLIRSIAKAHRGQFNPRYKTWNVPRWAAPMVRDELQQKSKTLYFGVGSVSSASTSSLPHAPTVAEYRRQAYE